MAAYFNLNNNEMSKEHLVNKFSMTLGNQGRLMLNDQKLLSPNENRIFQKGAKSKKFNKNSN